MALLNTIASRSRNSSCSATLTDTISVDQFIRQGLATEVPKPREPRSNRGPHVRAGSTSVLQPPVRKVNARGHKRQVSRNFEPGYVGPDYPRCTC
jgi:hypothetical protein